MRIWLARVRRYDQFTSQAESFHGEFTAYFHTLITKGVPFSSEALEALPRFVFEDEPAGDLALRTLAAALFLFLLSLCLVGGAWVRLREIGRLTR